jgi:hypothetical protein
MYEKRMCLAFGVITVLSLFFAYCIFRVCQYYSINPLGLDLGKTKISMHLTYPPSLNSQHGVIASVKFDIESEKAITEEINLTLKNVQGTLLTGTYSDGHLISDSNVRQVEIGFKDAHPDYWETMGTFDKVLNQAENRTFKALSVGLIRKNDLAQFTGKPMDTNEHNSSIKILAEWWNREFYFPVAGDYSPTIVIFFKDMTMKEHTYNDLKLRVLSESEIQTQALNHINALIMIILLIFGYIQLLKIINVI